jgi:hypothetical protein
MVLTERDQRYISTEIMYGESVLKVAKQKEGWKPPGYPGAAFSEACVNQKTGSTQSSLHCQSSSAQSQPPSSPELLSLSLVLAQPTNIAAIPTATNVASIFLRSSMNFISSPLFSSGRDPTELKHTIALNW